MLNVMVYCIQEIPSGKCTTWDTLGAKVRVKLGQIVPITGKWRLEAIESLVHIITHIRNNDDTNCDTPLPKKLILRLFGGQNMGQEGFNIHFP